MLKIYTKTGDKGQTSLYGGKRVDKFDPQVEAYGTVDELNSAIGIAIAELRTENLELRTKNIAIILQEIQSDLFFIGAMLAGDERDVESRIKNQESRVKELEQMIDWMAGKMPAQKHFILPGGSKPSAFLQLARSICRRAERRVVVLGREGVEGVEGRDGLEINQVIIYLNRLSDFLFTLARFINFSLKTPEPEWKSTP